MSDLLQRRKTYNFETYVPSILSTSFKGVYVTSILDEESARAAGVNTREMHAAIFPFLPAGSPNDPTSYDYYRLKTATGQIVIVGEPWIKPDSVQLIDAVTYMVKITGKSAGDYNTIRDALLGSDITAFEITTL